MTTKDRSIYLNDSSFSVHMIPSVAINDKEKWRVVMKHMENNPSMLLDLMPSPRDIALPESKVK